MSRPQYGRARDGEPGIQLGNLGESRRPRPRLPVAQNQPQLPPPNGNAIHLPVGIPADNEPAAPTQSKFLRRHIQMVALGTAIGSGLLSGTGKVFYFAGPVSILFAYLLMGTLVFAVLITMGEMISLLPITGGFFALANRCLSRKIGFICGWSYWFAYVIGFAAQLVSADNIISFWLPKDQYANWTRALWITLFFLIPVIFNNFNVRTFGRIEYWLTLVKIVMIVAVIFMGVLLAMGAAVRSRLLATDNFTPVACPANPSPGQCLGEPGFEYWHENAAMPYIGTGSSGGFLQFWSCCCQAIFAYLGVEIIAIAANETERQRHTLPLAVRRVSYRIVIYYVGAIFVLGLNVSRKDPILANDLSTSYPRPFVLMVQRAGLSGLPHVINAVALFASISVANANLYVTTRTLYALAAGGQFTERILTTFWNDVPLYCLVISAAPALLAYLSLLDSTSAFEYLVHLSVACTLIPWAVICATYIRFRWVLREKGTEDEIPAAARSPLQLPLACYGLLMSTLIFLFQGFEIFSQDNPLWPFLNQPWPGYTIAPWIVVGLVLLLFLGWMGWLLYEYFVHGTWNMLVPQRDVDVDTGKTSADDDDEEAVVAPDWQTRWLNRLLDAL